MTSPTDMTLSELGLNVTQGKDCAITGLSVDSRRTKEGHLFAALNGEKWHGGEFIEYALRMGARAILTDAEGATYARSHDLTNVALCVVDDPRAVLAQVAGQFFKEQPAKIVAVTGTNGKTSVANFCRQLWELTGEVAVNFGTIGVDGAVSRPLTHTTPEPIELHGLLADLVNEGVTHSAMEASSHGLDQHRLDAVRLSAAAFTNFTQDHLDYHESFEAYFDAKMQLFNRVLPASGTAVINIDDPQLANVVDDIRANGQEVITVSASQEADLRLLNNRYDATGQDIHFDWRGKTYSSRLNLTGAFQATNALQAAALAIATGSDADAIFGALAELKTVQGRMELVAKRPNGAAIYVDFAHTEDALATALKALRPHVLGRLVVVFGAGGDRDAKKRIPMGQAAAKYADVAIVTDDNPRSEEPSTIRAALMQGCPEATEIADRAHAILAGVDMLGAGDVLLIAGKGHETGQIIGDVTLPFNDAEQASIAVQALAELDV